LNKNSDGHGVLGHEVSGFLKKNLPVNMENCFKNNKINTFDIPTLKNHIEKTFQETCNFLNFESKIETKFRY
jgi:hypothetical protein